MQHHLLVRRNKLQWGRQGKSQVDAFKFSAILTSHENDPCLRNSLESKSSAHAEVKPLTNKFNRGNTQLLIVGYNI